jgi:hypothetical protein
MEQGSRMHLQLENSPKGLAACGLLYVTLALLLLQADFAPVFQLPMHALLAGLTWTAYRSTAGLGRGPVTLSRERGAWYISIAGRPRQRMQGIRAGLVRPWLLCAQLQCEHGRVSLLVFDDAMHGDAHWALRSLVLRGIPPQDADDETPGKG